MERDQSDLPTLAIHIEYQGPARLYPRKVQVLPRHNLQARLQQHRVPMPSEAIFVPARHDRNHPGFAFDKVGGQGCGPFAQTLVSLLKRDDVSLKARDHFGHPIGIPAAIQPDALANVPTCQLHGNGFALSISIHAANIGTMPRRNDIPYVTWIVWFILAAATIFALFTKHWSNVFVAVTALFLTVLPTIFSERFKIRLPLTFLGAISAFVFGTLFLGEVFDFYERFWWWDVLLHTSSAIGFGIIGFLFVFYLFEGDRYAAPPWALGLIAFCFAVSIGTLWEIFEFGMDQLFGLNMQKSGLPDTMTDLIVDSLGAFTGAISGFFWLKGRQIGFTGMIEEFIQLNRAGYSKLKDRVVGEDET